MAGKPQKRSTRGAAGGAAEAAAAQNEPGAGVREVEQVTRAKWVEQAEPSDAADTDAVLVDGAEEVNEDDFFAEADPLEDFFGDNEDFQTVEIYKHPNYAATGRSDPRAGRMEFQGELMFSPSIRADIQAAFGGGAFTVIRRGTQGQLSKRRTVFIAEPRVSPTPYQHPAPVPVAPSNGQTAKADDPLRTALESAMIRRLNRMMDEAMDPTLRQPAPALPGPAASPTSSLDELDRTVDLVEKITSINEKIHPPASGSSFLGDLALFMNALGVKELVGPLLTKAMTMQIGAGGMPQLPPGSPGTQSVPPAVAGGSADSEQLAWQTILTTLVHDLQLNKRAGRTADVIEEMSRRFPSVHAGVLQILALSNDQVLAQVHALTQVDLTQYAHATGFLDDVRDELEDFLSELPAVAGGPEDPVDSTSEANGSEVNRSQEGGLAPAAE